MLYPFASVILVFLATWPFALARPQRWNHNYYTAVQDLAVQGPVVQSTSSSTSQAPVATSTGGSSSAAIKDVGTTTTTTTTSSGGNTVGGAGMVYDADDAASVSRAASMKVAWGCDWTGTSAISNPSFAYKPQLWGPTKPITATDATDSDLVFYYNEPELCSGGGSCVAVEATYGSFPSFKSQFAGKKVSSPCTSAGGATFMTEFLGNVTRGSVDVLCFHWYGTDDLAGLKTTVNTFLAIGKSAGITEFYINEMGDYSNPTDISQYTDYLSGAVHGYAYNLANLGTGGTIG